MKTKKTYELSEESVKVLSDISQKFDLFEVEIVELAITKPRIYGTLLKIVSKEE